MKYKILYLPLFISIISCKGFESLNAKMVNENIIFYNKEISETCTKSLLVNDFWVQYISDTEKKIAWSIVRENSFSTEDIGFNFPLTYGTPPDGVKTTNPKIDLTPGRYNYSGTISCVGNSAEKGYELSGYFLIENNGEFVPGR